VRALAGGPAAAGRPSIDEILPSQQLSPRLELERNSPASSRREGVAQARPSRKSIRGKRNPTSRRRRVLDDAPQPRSPRGAHIRLLCFVTTVRGGVGLYSTRKLPETAEGAITETDRTGKSASICRDDPT
jgi:hypothetical protein